MNGDTLETCLWFDNHEPLYRMGQYFVRTCSTKHMLARRLRQTVEADTPEHMTIDIDAVDWQTVATHVTNSYSYEGG